MFLIPEHKSPVNWITQLILAVRHVNTRIKVNPKNNQTTNKQYFAGGDAINGGAEVVNGAYDGKFAAQGIHQWLNQ